MEVLHLERYRLLKVGVSPSEWAGMTKWQRQDILFRHGKEVKEALDRIKKAPEKEKLGTVAQIVIGKLLGM